MTNTSVWDFVSGGGSSAVPSWLTTPGTTMGNIGGAQYPLGSPSTTYSDPYNPFGFGSGTVSPLNAAFGGGTNFNPGGSTGTGGTGGYSGGPNSLNSYGFPSNDSGSGSGIFSGGTGGTGGSTDLTSLNMFPGLGGAGFDKIFGPLGPYLQQALQSGGYNPGVFEALVKQLQPQVDRGVATIGANTGASGTRFGSGYDLALGDYLSQVNANEGAMAAGLYEQAVQNSFNILGATLGDTAQFKSNQGGFNTALITSLIGALGPKLLNSIPWLSGNSNAPIIKNYGGDPFGNSGFGGGFSFGF